MTRGRGHATTQRRTVARRATTFVSLTILAAMAFPAGPAFGAGIPAKTVAQAKVVVHKAEQIPKFTPPSAPFSTKSVRGKSIMLIPLSSAIPACEATDTSMESIATKLGMTATEFSNTGDPSQWGQGVTQAISQHMSAIFLQCGINPALIGPQLEEARKAGIPVFDGNLNDPSVPMPTLLTAETAGPFNQMYKILADDIIANSGGKVVHALMVTSYDVTPARGAAKAFVKQLKALCKSCTALTTDVSIADWSSTLGTTVAAELSAHSNINVIVPEFDGMVPSAVSADTSSHRNLPIYTDGAASAILQEMKGQPLIKGDIGPGNVWQAYADMNQILRVLTKHTPIPKLISSEPRLFVVSNVSQASSPTNGFGAAFVTGYEKLWGLHG